MGWAEGRDVTSWEVASPVTPGLEPDSNRRAGREAIVSKGVHLEGLRLGGTRSDLHFQKKIVAVLH